jgi:hypothetical protein
MSDILKSIALSFLALLLIMDIPLFLVFFNTKTMIFDAKFYEGILEKSGAYTSLREALVTQLVNGLASSPELKLMGVTKAELTTEMRAAIPESWAKKQLNGFIENGIAYAKGESGTLLLRISFSEIKPSFTSAVINITMRHISLGLPINSTQIEQNIAAQIAQQLPDDIDASQMIFNGPEGAQAMVGLREGAKLVIFASDVTMAITAVIIGLIVLLTLNIKSTSRTLGVPLLIGGIGAFVLGTLAPPIVSGMAQGASGGTDIASAVVLAGAQQVFDIVKFQGILIAAAGFVLVIISFLWKEKR